MKARVVHPRDLGAEELARWSAIQAEAGLVSPFLSPTFARAVGEVRDQTRVAVLEEGGETIGFFAFEQSRFGLARPVGAGVSDVQGVVAAEPPPLEDVLCACGLRSYDYSYLTPQQAGPAATRHTTLHVDMPDGFEAYHNAQKAGARRLKEAARQRRKLAREVGPVELDPGPHPHGELEWLLRLKSNQYRRTGMPDLFSEAWVGELARRLLDAPEPGCETTLWVLRAGGRPVGSSLALRAGAYALGWVQAYDPDMARHSPGWHLMLGLIEAEAARGVRHFSLGPGDQPYKKSMATGSGFLAQGTAVAPGAVGRALAVRHEPRRRAEAFVLRRPALRRAVRRGLREVGRVRTGT